jgi:hypothetical protein
MSLRGWTRFASGASSRALKYRHLFDEALGLSEPQISLLAVLMLRGPQTLGELKGRSERMHHFESLEDVQATVDGLAERELVVRVPRRPGQKEDRYGQLLGGDEGEPAASPVPDTAAPPTTVAESADADRLSALERRVDELERAVAEFRERLAGEGIEQTYPNL